MSDLPTPAPPPENGLAAAAPGEQEGALQTVAPAADVAGVQIGEVLGAYRILEMLGHSHASRVYLAERQDDRYAGLAVIKLLPADAQGQVLGRFVIEKYTLAHLNHPFIARLYDAGESRAGHPYLVMEHVPGEPVDRYCNARQLELRQRLELFIKVCGAVQHAHQRLVIHRNLKPTNILITPMRFPKLLDFGIAKWLDPSTLPASSQGLTRVMNDLPVLVYASPEQVQGAATGVTSDVYSLGVVLYELLTGALPYPLPAGDSLQTERLICEMDAPAPSQKLKALSAQQQATIAHHCNTTPARLRASLRGDLDAIVLRALRKEPEARYRSVADLVDDLHNHLNLQPVNARQGNWWYYSRRHVHKHWEKFAYGSGVLAALAVSVTLITLQANRLAEQTARTQKQNQRSDAVTDFMQEVFSATPVTADELVYAKSLLDQAGKVIGQSHGLDPTIRAKLLAGIGKSYARQARPREAIPFLKESFALLQQQSNASTELVAKTTSNLARALGDSGLFSEASPYLAYGVKYLQVRGDTHSEAYAELIFDQGAIAAQSRNWPEALSKYQQALSLYEALYGNRHPEVASVKMSIGNVYVERGHIKAALQQVRGAAAIYNATLSEGHPDRIVGSLSLALLLSQVGEQEAGYQLGARQADIQRRSAGEKNLRIMYILATLSDLGLAADRIKEAEAAAKEALDIAAAYLGEHDPLTAINRTMFADVLIHQRRYQAALQEIELVMNDLKFTGPAHEEYFISAETLKAIVCMHAQCVDEAVALLEKGIKRMRALNCPAWRIARSQGLLAAIQWQRTRDPAAKKLLLDSWWVMADPDNGAPALQVKDARLRTQAIVGALPALKPSQAHSSR